MLVSFWLNHNMLYGRAIRLGATQAPVKPKPGKYQYLFIAYYSASYKPILRCRRKQTRAHIGKNRSNRKTLYIVVLIYDSQSVFVTTKDTKVAKVFKVKAFQSVAALLPVDSVPLKDLLRTWVNSLLLCVLQGELQSKRRSPGGEDPLAVRSVYAMRLRSLSVDRCPTLSGAICELHQSPHS
jgi:hypothetical protein